LGGPTDRVRPSPRQRREESARGWSDVLAEVPLFAGLSRRHRNKVAALARIRRFHEGTPIVRAGEAGGTFFVLLDGKVSVRRRGLPDLSLGIGTFFGELSLLDGGTRSCGVHKSGSCREAVFVDQSAEAISTCDFARSGRAGE
jgi:hypothetical protein